jgi:hypothetical protein
MASKLPEYGYIAYIDEGGETGLAKVRPIDENGSSEWFVLSAVVMRAKWEPDVVGWVREIRDAIGVKQRPDLHYRTLSPTRKVAVCTRVAQLPLRGFVIASNKKNMRRYRNENAAKIPSQQWFYNWCIRLLLERVTAFCDERTLRDFGERRPIKIEFSRCGGHRYSQTKAYHAYLSFQQEGDKVFLQKRQPVRDLLSTDLMFDFPHEQRAGLQLADIVASAFYQAADADGPGEWCIDGASALAPIMAKENGAQRDFGVALFPTPDWRADLTDDQKQIFRAYGYDFISW